MENRAKARKTKVRLHRLVEPTPRKIRRLCNYGRSAFGLGGIMIINFENWKRALGHRVAGGYRRPRGGKSGSGILIIGPKAPSVVGFRTGVSKKARFSGGRVGLESHGGPGLLGFAKRWGIGPRKKE